MLNLLKIKTEALKVSAFLVLVAVPVTLSLAATKIEINGLEEGLKQNVDARVSAIDEKLINTSFRFKRYLYLEIQKALRAKGYYSPTMKFDEQGANDNNTLIVNIIPGPPTINESINVTFHGAGENDPDYLKIKQKYDEQKGKILDHSVYESLKKLFPNLALKKGYFDAELTESQLGIAKEQNKAYWTIDFNTGERYRFGPVNFTGSQIKESFLRSIIPFNEGDYFTSEQIGVFNRQLSSTNWFSSVTIAPQFDQARESKILPLDVVLMPRKANSIETGIGYSTSVGPRAKITWNKPWLNYLGHSLQTSLSVSKPEQELTFNYKMPLSKSPLVHYYSLQGGYKRENNNDTNSRSMTAIIARHWDFPVSWNRVISFTANYDDFTQGDERHKTFLLYPSVMISRMRSDGKLVPMWGDFQQYSIDYSNKIWGSDISLIALQLQNTWIRSISDKNRFIARGSWGYIHANDFSRVPPSLRYFAGGDRSIRGYDYKTVSPRDDKGKLIGGTRLATGSIEYQYNVKGPWWGAMFFDAGQVANKFTQRGIKTGAGVGIRWSSPVGPVKFDIAVPISSDEKHRPHFYISLGPEL